MSKTRTDVPSRIEMRVSAEAPVLAQHLREWFEAHRTTPRQMEVSSDPEGKQAVCVWLVTDDTGTNDGSSRIVYDEACDAFGLVMTLQSGIEWYMGPYGSLTKAVEGI